MPLDKETVRARLRKAGQEAVTSAKKLTGEYQPKPKRGFWDANSNDEEPAPAAKAPTKKPTPKPVPKVAAKPSSPSTSKVKRRVATKKKPKPGFWDPNTND